ncbi:DUF6933 domain-containing protein [Methylomarinum vadi]|uniref:DUF6933 domain-containing protein n=1 Tax=Methylomarinum vadi TaxID=438855 RepID=UPI0004DF2FC1|nr:hypothetical protein [Methylomarinum vadi]
MQLVRCTQKLQKEMGLKKANLIAQEPDEATLGSWHANLLFIKRRKCVLFVNDKTLFNFIIPDLKRERIRQLDTLFGNLLQCVLAEEGFDESLRDRIMREYENIGYAATNNRIVMGSMNDLAFHYQIQIEMEGGVHSPMIPQIIHKLNRMSMKALDYDYPIVALYQLYGLQRKR